MLAKQDKGKTRVVDHSFTIAGVEFEFRDDVYYVNTGLMPLGSHFGELGLGKYLERIKLVTP